MLHHPVFDHHIVHGDANTNRIRIVARADVAWASAELGLMFPHETVHSTPIGCCHVCVYTEHAAPSHVAERIAEHLHNVTVRGDTEPAPRPESEGRHPTDEPRPDFFGVEKDTRRH